MSANLNDPAEAPVPLTPDDSDPQPVPVDPQPVKVQPAQVDEKISLIDDFDESAPTQRKAFGTAAAAGDTHKKNFKRPMNTNGNGATRCRLFYSKIQANPLLHMENIINDWMDEEGVEVKQVAQCIGTMEGKRSEPNLLVTVWY